MQVNASYIQVRGKLEIEKPLQMGDPVKVELVVTDIEYKDNQDGTQDCVYKAKLWQVEEE